MHKFAISFRIHIFETWFEMKQKVLRENGWKLESSDNSWYKTFR